MWNTTTNAGRAPAGNWPVASLMTAMSICAGWWHSAAGWAYGLATTTPPFLDPRQVRRAFLTPVSRALDAHLRSPATLAWMRAASARVPTRRAP